MFFCFCFSWFLFLFWLVILFKPFEWFIDCFFFLLNLFTGFRNRKGKIGNLERMESKSEVSLSSQSSGISEFSDDDLSLMELGSGNYGYVSIFLFQLKFESFGFRLLVDFLIQNLGFFVVELRCSHYRRRCKIRAPCCNEIFDCRHCHNEAKVYIHVNIYLFLSFFLGV